MKTFTLPGTNITLNRLGYGAMRLTGPHIWGPPRDVPAAIEVLQQAVQSGVNHLDTSDFYGPHITNQLIRKALAPYGKDLTIVTKVGFRRDPDTSWKPAHSAAELEKAVDDNRNNLGIDQLAVVNLRMPDNSGSLREPLEALIKLQNQGKIRHLGISNVSQKQYLEARGMANIVCVQNLYNLVHRKDEELLQLLAHDKVAYVPFFPLGGFSPLQNDRLNRIAEEVRATPMQVALAWLLEKSPNILLIPGTSSVKHLRENLAAAELKLTPEMVNRLNAIAG